MPNPKPDRLDPRRTDQDLRRVLVALIEARPLWEQAVDGGSWAPRTGNGGRGTGFTDLKPVESSVFSPTQRQLRSAARRAAGRISRAAAELEDAVNILHAGIFRTDPEVLDDHLEKRRAATQGGP